MKYPVFVLLFLFLMPSACKPVRQNKPVEQVPAYENHFFTLDFEKHTVSMESFRTHFFTNFPHLDPTQGTVVYDQSVWKNDDLLRIAEQEGLFATIRDRGDSLGFDSHRFTSKSYFNLNDTTRRILFVFKGSLPQAKGMWPAWWLNGSREKPWLYQDSMPILEDPGLSRFSGVGMPYNTQSAVNNTDWPAAGEIDIIENINAETIVHNTLHTCPQMCDSEWNSDGKRINCANAIPGDDVNKGCSGQPYTVDKLAGTFACLWEAESIRFYHWPEGSSVRDEGGPLSQQPDPARWTGLPLKNTVRLLTSNTPCTDTLHQDWQCRSCAGRDQCIFKNMKMVFNVTFCGIWAGTHFDATENAWDNCREYILGEGRETIDKQYMKIEYVSAVAL
jgi:hypothetical protein